MLRRLLRDSGRRWHQAENLRGRRHPYGWDQVPPKPRSKRDAVELESLGAMMGLLMRGAW